MKRREFTHAARRRSAEEEPQEDDDWDGNFEFLDQLRGRPDWRDIPVVVITARDLTDEDRDRLNGGVERIIQKSDRDEMLRQLSREISRCVKLQAPRGV